MPEAKDHPRLRGEHRFWRLLKKLAPGSSPLTRGALTNKHGVCVYIRIIPAYAGSTHPPASRYLATRDHPRLRGEHLLAVCDGLHCGGSSPLTRGARRYYKNRIVARGIIPAYAGSTYTSKNNELDTGDHPRLRGEHCPSAARPSRRRGSSPLTRGAPCMLIGDRPEHGIIPAYAGSTTSRAS